MKFLSVNYYLNATYNVEDVAINQMIKSAAKETKNISLISSEVEIAHNSKSFSASVEISLNKGKSIEKSLVNFQKNIEQKSLALTGSKPENVEILIREK